MTRLWRRSSDAADAGSRCRSPDGYRAGEDGLIEDPRQCRFEPKSLRCQGADGRQCLTAAEAQVLEKWYGGPKTSQGEPVYPGVMLGSAPHWSLWRALEDEATWRNDKAYLRATLRYYGLPEDPGPDYDVADFDFDEDPQRLTQTYTEQEAGGTDLAKFKARGGKFLIYQGWADASVPAEAIRRWYEALSKDMGGAAATQEFARLFLVPGMDHCGIRSDPGVHHSGFDPLSALEQWVEEGTPPEAIVMTKTNKDGKTEWTRPVCAYPKAAAYDGSGDLKDAANWTCGGT